MSKPDGKLSLVDFAAANKRKRVCRVCDLPELQEITDARAAGVSCPTILNWLVPQRGYETGWITKSRLEDHFRNNHNA